MEKIFKFDNNDLKDKEDKLDKLLTLLNELVGEESGEDFEMLQAEMKMQRKMADFKDMQKRLEKVFARDKKPALKTIEARMTWVDETIEASNKFIDKMEKLLDEIESK